jgi:hypothetical protein
MPPDEIRSFLRARPFVPFRLCLTDGWSFEIRHPELLMVGARAVVIGIPQAGVPDPLFERTITVSLLHVVSIEPLESSAAAKGNGAQA